MSIIRGPKGRADVDVGIYWLEPDSAGLIAGVCEVPEK